MKKRHVILAALMSAAALLTAARPVGRQWTPAQVEQLSELSIATLEAPRPDPTNRVADDPRAVALGQRLFFDTRLSSNGQVSCATCHKPERDFQDGTPLGRGVGTTNRRTMPVTGTAHSPFLFWDGRKDSQWAQALGPLESAVEHGGTRSQYAQLVVAEYRPQYEELFGAMPDLSSIPAAAGPAGDAAAKQAWDALTPERRDEVTRVFVNVGKAIASYERRLDYAPSRFDRYVEAVVNGGDGTAVLSEDEVAGLRLFIGKANCTQCHNGPTLTNNEFHNTGVPANPVLPEDRGRMSGATQVGGDEFNCRSRWSDASPARCAELDFMVSGDPVLERAYKVPSLRNVADRPPYMHAGQFATLTDVLDHYNRAPRARDGHSELKPLRMTAKELRQLEAFLRTLSGGTAAPPELLRDPFAGAERGSGPGPATDERQHASR